MDSDALMFITGVKFSKKTLEELNGITFLFDPNWEPGIGNTPTLPLSIFHVKSQRETMTSETSQKQVILYSSGRLLMPDTVSNSVTSVISDNIVIKPKAYTLDILVPSDTGSIRSKIGALNAYQTGGVFSFIAEHSIDSISRQYVGSILNQGIRLFDLVLSLVSDIGTAIALSSEQGLKATFKSIFLNITESPEYNKNSLEAMWRNRSILKFKIWNSWRYKYVVITSLDLNKEGTSDGMYEGTMTLQEVPILTVRSGLDALAPSVGWKNIFVKLAGNTLKYIINSMESSNDN